MGYGVDRKEPAVLRPLSFSSLAKVEGGISSSESLKSDNELEASERVNFMGRGMSDW